MKQFRYNLIFRPEPEGGFTVTVPALPGCITYGKNLEDAKEMAEDAIKAYLLEASHLFSDERGIELFHFIKLIEVIGENPSMKSYFFFPTLRFFSAMMFFIFEFKS